MTLNVDNTFTITGKPRTMEYSERAWLVALRKSIKCAIRQAEWQLSEIDKRLKEIDKVSA